MSQPHSASDSGFFMLPLVSNVGNTRSAPDVLLSELQELLVKPKLYLVMQTVKDAISLDTFSYTTRHIWWNF